MFNAGSSNILVKEGWEKGRKERKKDGRKKEGREEGNKGKEGVRRNELFTSIDIFLKGYQLNGCFSF